MRAVKQTVEEYQLPVAVVAAGYAEGETIGSVPPLAIPEIASEAGCDFAMIDTYNKMLGRTLFDLLSVEQLQEFMQDCHTKNLGAAIGGSIKKEHLPIIKQLQPDIIGIRGAEHLLPL